MTFEGRRLEGIVEKDDDYWALYWALKLRESKFYWGKRHGLWLWNYSRGEGVELMTLYRMSCALCGVVLREEFRRCDHCGSYKLREIVSIYGRFYRCESCGYIGKPHGWGSRFER